MAKFSRRSAFVLGAIVMLSFLLLDCSSRKPSGVLVYKGPIELSVAPGNALAGTDILYVGAKDGAAEFRIEGQQALKKVGDSLDWKGTPRKGVHLDLRLRLLVITEQSAHVGGTVSIEVENPSPTAASPDTDSIAKFSVPVTYAVDRGDYVPGTLIIYKGQDEAKGAELGGIEGYPYRRTGDSITWEGRLNDSLFIKLDLRALFYNDSSLRVGGIATLWLK